MLEYRTCVHVTTCTFHEHVSHVILFQMLNILGIPNGLLYFLLLESIFLKVPPKCLTTLGVKVLYVLDGHLPCFKMKAWHWLILIHIDP